MPAWSPPSEFDEYRLVKVLGRGAMGTVWLAHDENLDRAVAIKVISAADPAPATRERFFIEARAVARLHHPNVVTVHRVGSAGGQPYLVSEYVRGKTLAELPRPIAGDLAARLAVGLARGLAAAHRAGVLHRDLKPANALLADDGEVKLVDFGLAKLLEPGSAEPAIDVTATSPSESQAGAMIGTPAFMAPELWLGEPATARSDVYALGATLFMLLAGRPPHEAASSHALAIKVASEAAPPLRALCRDVPELLASVIDACLRRDPDERPASGEALREALEPLLGRRAVATLAGENPYRGLHGFQQEHRDLFFGRDLETGDLLERMRGEPWVVIAGRSGTGKSSLVRAGLIPRIQDGALKERESDATVWRAVTVLPGASPHTALLAACAPLTGKPEETLAADPTALARELRAQRGRAALIFVDQLEELITLAEPGERERFIETLRPLLALSPSLRVVATVRSDFVGHFEVLGSLHREFARALYVLGPLTPEGLRDAVVAPAEAGGHHFESEALIEALVAPVAADQGSLPLLSFALARLWDERDQEKKLLSAEALERIGGVAGALARHADDVLAALPPAGRACARRLLGRLVTAERTRARRSLDELAGDDAELARETLEALVRGRLLSTGEVEGRAVFEVAHEALITGWDRLRGWLDEQRDEQRLLERVETAAAAWAKHGRGVDSLWRGRLVDDLARLPPEPPPLVDEFSAASRRAEGRARWRRRAALVAIPTLVFGTILGVQGYNAYADRAVAEAAVARAEVLLAQGRAKNATVEARRTAAFAAYDRGDDVAGKKLWDEVAALTEEERRAYDAVEAPLDEALGTVAAYAPARRAAASLHADLLRIAERDHDARALELHQARLRFYDGERRHAALLAGAGTLRVESDPPGARFTLARFDRRKDGTLVEQPLEAGLVTPIQRPLPMGSYVLRFESGIVAPVLVGRLADKTVRVRAAPPPAPPGFRYVPGGTFLQGTLNSNLMATMGAAPQHETATGPYFIAETEVTIADWITYLGELPPAARVTELSQVRLVAQKGGYGLDVDGKIYPPGTPYHFVAEERGVEMDSDWRRWPVVNLSALEADGYAAWLARTGRVPGARLCTEKEWELAARGADGRPYPGGWTLLPGDANHRHTYGVARSEIAYLDEVGRYEKSRSVFGVMDLVGNAFEWTADGGDERVMKSGSHKSSDISLRADSRFRLNLRLRYDTAGVRVCADAQ